MNLILFLILSFITCLTGGSGRSVLRDTVEMLKMLPDLSVMSVFVVVPDSQSKLLVHDLMKDVRLNIYVEILRPKELCSFDASKSQTSPLGSVRIVFNSTGIGEQECLRSALEKSVYGKDSVVVICNGTCGDLREGVQLQMNSGAFQVEQAGNMATLFDLYQVGKDFEQTSTKLFQHNGSRIERYLRTSVSFICRGYDIIKFHYSCEGLVSVWNRRSDLMGQTFRGLLSVWHPYITSFGPITSGEGHDQQAFVEAEGMFIDLITMVGLSLNFSVTAERPVRNWSKMVSLVANKTYDIGITGYSQTFERSELVDFSTAFSSAAIRLFFPATVRTHGFFVYLGSFKLAAWAGLCLVMTVLCLALSTITFFDIGGNFTAISSTVFVFFAQIGRRFPMEPKNTAMRIAFVSVSFGGFIVISLYR